MPIVLDAPDYNQEYTRYMADVVSENERRRRLLISRPDPRDPRFSPESEVVRQNAAISRANASETTNPINLDETPKPINLDDPEPNTAQPGGVSEKPQSKPFHPGQILDWFMAPMDPDLAPSVMGEPPKPTVDAKAPFHPGQMIGRVGDAAREIFHDAGTLALDAITTPATWLLGGGLRPGTPRVEPIPPPKPSLADLRPVDIPRESLPTGPYSGEVGARLNPATPEAIPYQGIEPQIRRIPTGNFVLPGGEAPSITDLARAQQYRPEGFTSARPFVFPDEAISRDITGNEGIPTTGYRSARPFDPEEGVLPGGYPHDPLRPQLSEQTHVFETPGFLKTAEERIAGKASLPGESDLLHGSIDPPIRETQSITPPLVSQQATEGVNSGVRRAFEAQRLKDIRKQNMMEKENLTFAKEYVDEMSKTLPQLPKVSFDDLLLKQPDQAGPRTTPPALPGVSDPLNQRIASKWEKIWLQSLDVLKRLGPRTERVADILEHSKLYSEQGTMQNFHDVVGLVEKYFGQKSLSNRALVAKQAGTKWEGLQTLLNPSSADWGLTKQQNDAVAALVFAELDPSRLSPIARTTLPIDNPQVMALAKEYWQVAFGRASSLPSVRNMRVYDFLTGESYPVGDVGPHLPHMPINEETRNILSRETLKKMWEHGHYEDKGISFETFRTEFPKWWNKEEADAPGRLRKFAGLEHKKYLTDDIVKDEAIRNNMTEIDVLRKYGYETDIIRLPVRSNYYKLRRGKLAEFEQELKDLQNQIALDYGDNHKMTQWINRVIERSQGISAREDVIEKSNNLWDMAQAILYPALLKGSWKQNIVLQPNYAALQTGIRPVAQAIWKYWGGKLGWSDAKILEAAERSGSTFPAHLTAYHLPETKLQQYAKTTLSWDMFSPSDSLTRRIYGMSGGIHFEKVAKEFYKDPANPRWKTYINEYKMNPAEVYAEMAAQPKEAWVGGGPVVPKKFISRAQQVAANKSMGRTGTDFLPAWAAGDTEAHQAFLMLRRQILSNESTLVNMFLDKPGPIALRRFLTMVVGADAAGLMYNGLANWFMGQDLLYVNKSLKQAFGEQGDTDITSPSLHAKAILMGLGTLTSGLLLTGLNAMGGNPYGGAAYSFMSPAVASVVDEGVNAMLRGQFGEFAARLQPSEFVQTLKRRYDNEEREQRGKGGAGLPNPMRVP